MEKNYASFWINCKKIYSTNDGLTLISGLYYGREALGLQWDDRYPSSRGKLVPFYLDDEMGKLLLSGLLQKAIINHDQEMFKHISQAIEFLEINK